MKSFNSIVWLACVVAYFGTTDAAITAWSSPGAADGGAEGVITPTAIAENSKAEGETIFTATATSDTEPAPTLTYALSSSTDSVGDIDTSSGDVTVATGKALDYEAFTTYEFVITGTDDGGTNFMTVTVSLDVTDVNDNTPTFTAATVTATVADKAAAGTSVTTLTATDADGTAANHVITYSIDSGNTNSDFAIDGTTGVVTVAATNGLDRSTTPHYALVIHATDSGTPALSGVTTLSIIVSASDSAAAMNVVSLLSLVAVGLGHMLV